jgi:glycosyltransferase involved in cell wall biosynthesis
MKKRPEKKNETALTFTVFTPTYNRGHTLERVYESLKAQTYKNFEWVVVDDGSIDRTADMISQWAKEAHFPIHYFFQVNQGKHVAFNLGLEKAAGTFFVPLDSDDTCLPHALERLLAIWDSIPLSQQENFSGVCVLCINQHGDHVGSSFPGAVMDSTPSEITYKYKVTGEKWGCHRTEVLRAYPFPSLEGVRYIPESLLWNQVGQAYKMRCVNEALRVYYESSSPDTLTALSTTEAYLLGRLYFYVWSFNHNSRWFFSSPWCFFKDAIQYGRFSRRLGISWREQYDKLTQGVGQGLFLLATPVSFLLYKWDRLQLQKSEKPTDLPSEESPL